MRSARLFSVPNTDRKNTSPSPRIKTLGDEQSSGSKKKKKIVFQARSGYLNPRVAILQKLYLNSRFKTYDILKTEASDMEFVDESLVNILDFKRKPSTVRAKMIKQKADTSLSNKITTHYAIRPLNRTPIRPTEKALEDPSVLYSLEEEVAAATEEKEEFVTRVEELRKIVIAEREKKDKALLKEKKIYQQFEKVLTDRTPTRSTRNPEVWEKIKKTKDTVKILESAITEFLTKSTEVLVRVPREKELIMMYKSDIKALKSEIPQETKNIHKLKMKTGLDKKYIEHLKLNIANQTQANQQFRYSYKNIFDALSKREFI